VNLSESRFEHQCCRKVVAYLRGFFRRMGSNEVRSLGTTTLVFKVDLPFLKHKEIQLMLARAVNNTGKKSIGNTNIDTIS